jgi:hypothetical protein
MGAMARLCCYQRRNLLLLSHGNIHGVIKVNDWLENHASPQRHLVASEGTNHKECTTLLPLHVFQWECLSEVSELIIIWSIGPGAAITGQSRRPLCVEKIPSLGEAWHGLT